jgi:class 3 adenylate cyclase
MLLGSALLSIVMGTLVFFVGQERRIKGWFLLLCVAAAMLTFGIWIEINVPNLSVPAARLNMTNALLIAVFGLLSVRRLCGLPLRAPTVALVVAATAVNIGTVWLTEVYFTGKLLHYPWGVYVAGDSRFALNPLLVATIAILGLVNLWVYYRTAHPLDRNRAKYIFLANAIFATSAFDYLPHFNIDPFHGPISGISIPVFLAVYGYAMLRFRLFDFHELVGLGSGWVLAAVLLGTTYALVVEVGDRFGLLAPRIHLLAALVAFGLWLTLARQMPAWVNRLFSDEPDFIAAVNRFSDEVAELQEEGTLKARWEELCLSTFAAERAWFIESNRLNIAVDATGVLEREPLVRDGREWPEAAANADLLFPLRRREELLGAVAVGARKNGRMYPDEALVALRRAANVLSTSFANLRSAVELEKRHQLDRYLAPQIIEGILGRDPEAVSRMRRMLITVFFSDIKGFSEFADRLDPDDLSVVMNEYLSEMADIAFSHGGTVDKFIGDAVMVLFGAPIEEDASKQVQQCVAMACEMYRRTKQLSQRWSETAVIRDGVISRMGIHTGEATVGSFGSRTRLEYTALGRSVNLASRLERACEPGRILVSVDTWRYLAGTIQGECRGKMAMKGFGEAIEVYQIDPRIGFLSPRGGFPLVGRAASGSS